MTSYPHLLVAVDPAGCAIDVCAHASTLARALKSEITMLHVVHRPAGVPASAQVRDALGAMHGAVELLDEEAARELDALASQCRRAGVKVRTVVRHGAPAHEILDEARLIGASMIVTGTHGRKGARHLLFGSVAENVLRDAPCPVVVVRAPSGTPDEPSAMEQRVAAESMG